MNETPGRRPWWIAAALAAWGLVWLWQGLSLPQFDHYAGIGPGLLVTLIGAAMLLLAAILAWQISQGVRFEEQEAEDINTEHTVSRRGLVLSAAGAALPMLTMQPLGFIATGALSFTLVAAGFGSRRQPLDLLIGVVLAGACYWLFGLLGVNLGGLLPLAGI